MRNVRFLGLLLASASTLVASSAGADIPPSESEAVTLSMAVEGDVPEGLTLLLLDARGGASALEPGAAVVVPSPPFEGAMPIVSLSTLRWAAIEAAEEGGGALLEALEGHATPCGEITGEVPTYAAGERYDEIRRHYGVMFGAGACRVELCRTSYFAGGDEVAVVEAGAVEVGAAEAGAAEAGAAEAGAAEEPDAVEGPAAMPARKGPEPSGPGKPGNKCALVGPPNGEPGAFASLLALAGLVLVRRRRD